MIQRLVVDIKKIDIYVLYFVCFFLFELATSGRTSIIKGLYIGRDKDLIMLPKGVEPTKDRTCLSK